LDQSTVKLIKEQVIEQKGHEDSNPIIIV